MPIATIRALALSLIATSAAAGDYSAGQVKAECAAKWGSQYDMVKYCIDKRQEGWSGFSTYKQRFGSHPIIGPSLSHCEDKWGQQWDMVQFCTEKQFDGVETLNTVLDSLPANIANEIGTNCAAKWNPQFDMVGYCAKKQSAAWRALNQ